MEETKQNGNKKFIAAVAIILVVALLAGLVGGLAYRKAKGDISVAQANASHQSLTAGFTDVKIKDKSSALKAVDSVKEKLGLGSAEDELDVVGTEKSGGNKYYRMQQTYKGVPVYGRQVVVVADEDGNSLSLTTNYDPIGGELSIDPSVDEETVRKNVEKKLNKTSKKATAKAATTKTTKTTKTTTEEATESSKKTTERTSTKETTSKTTKTTEATTEEPTTEETTSAGSGNFVMDALSQANLVIYDFLQKGEAVLAYALNVKNAAGNWRAIVDANSGEVLDFLPMTFTSSANVEDAAGNSFTASFNRAEKVYLLEDESLKTYVATFDGGNSDNDATCTFIESEDDVFGNTATERALEYDKASEYYRTLTTIQKRFQKLYGAKGDSLLVALYNDGADFGNNGYASVDTMFGSKYIPDGTSIGVISLGMNKDVSTIDLIAHEYMHRVEQNRVGLYYRSESGAIMEAYSDVFGELLEADVNGSADWVHNGIRSLRSPLDTDDPEKYQGENWGNTASDYDHGDVHQNSTVLSHAAFLMNAGVDGSEALSDKQLGALWYEALARFTPDETFQQAAEALYATAQDQARFGRLSSEQVETVASALAAVGLPVTADAEPTTKPSAGVFTKKQELVVPKTMTYNFCGSIFQWTYDYDLENARINAVEEQLRSVEAGDGVESVEIFDGLLWAGMQSQYPETAVSFEQCALFESELVVAYNPLIKNGIIKEMSVKEYYDSETRLLQFEVEDEKLISIKDQRDGQLYSECILEYDNNNRVTRVAHKYSDTDMLDIARISYITSSVDKSIERIIIKKSFVGGYDDTYIGFLNKKGELEKIEHLTADQGSTTPFSDYTFPVTINRKGNITKIENPESEYPSRVVFEYDKNDNLMSVRDEIVESGTLMEDPNTFTYQTIEY